MLARLGTMLGDLEPVAPQEAFLNRLEDLLVARAKHVDARVMLRQVAVEVDGESEAVTTTTIAQLDDQIAELETAIKAVIASDPEQAERYGILTSIPGVGPVTAAALLCWHDAVAELRALQEHYRDCLDKHPDSLGDTPYGERLQAIVETDIEALEEIEPPRGYGRDT